MSPFIILEFLDHNENEKLSLPIDSINRMFDTDIELGHCGIFYGVCIEYGDREHVNVKGTTEEITNQINKLVNENFSYKKEQ